MDNRLILYTTIEGCNVYIYCNNNSINYYDPKGTDCICLYKRVRGDHVCVQDDFIFPSREEHYARNQWNVVPTQKELKEIVEEKSDVWEEADDKYNRYHRFTNGEQGNEAKYNKKYWAYNGRCEVIICYDETNVPTPYIVTDPNNMGTYNFGGKSWLDHFLKDVLPYYCYKNSEDDTTSLIERVLGKG